jgi:DNA-binding MarR family transcriptional regulator
MTPAQLNDLMKAVRGCFQRLKSLGEQLHSGASITIAMRAVLETLVEDGPRTVPQIARSKAVTRQHIQVIVDGLLAQKLVELDNNPAHRRSSIVVVTAKGAELFAEMRRREQRALTSIGRKLVRADAEPALRLLRDLNTQLDEHLAVAEHA